MQVILDFLQKFSYEIALAVNGNALAAFFLLFLFYLGFNLIESTIETLIWGKAFIHWFDPVFAAAWLWFTIMVILQCKNVR